ncbi:MAG: 8-amino-7-oxononanoate synthase [Kiritimatiellae bacterium]|nr:8-amino-7-oxononanoate synthase [Kiritimatiellia bacterium]
MTDDRWAQERLAHLHARHLHRDLRVCAGVGGYVTIDGRRCLNFSSNDYLNLACDGRLAAASAEAARAVGTGATGSRLMSGTLAPHQTLENRLAAHTGYPRALVFGSGYLTNLGVLAALVGRNDHVFADRLVHASIVDGILLSRARLHRFRHNDVDDLRARLARAPGGGRRLVVSESVFSMDGDLAPLAELAETAARAGADVMVDDAHAAGVFGPGGCGRVAAASLQPRVAVCVGTLSKAFGAYGGFVACSAALQDYLINHARSFIFSTALPPPCAAAAGAALDALAADPAMGERLLVRAGLLRDRLRAAGLDTGPSQSQIVPVLIGTSEKALAVAERLRRDGILAVAIRPPTVPANAARIRLSVTLAHAPAELERAAALIAEAARAEGVV